MRKIIFALLLVSVWAFAMAGCSQKEEADVGLSIESIDIVNDGVIDFSVGFITDASGIDDKSVNQRTWEGIVRFCEDTGAANASIKSESRIDYIENLSKFSEEGYNLVVAQGFAAVDAMTQAGNRFPENHFLIIDAVVNLDSVASAVFAEEQGSFLVGVAAAKIASKAGKNSVGFIGGSNSDITHKYEAGFEAGVQAVDSSINIVVDYIGDTFSFGIGQSIAYKMYNEGVYIIYHAADDAGLGIIDEAKSRRRNGEDVWVIGVDKDQYEEGLYDGNNSVILTSMIKRFDVAAYSVAEQTLNGQFPGGEILEFSLNNGGVDIPPENPNLSDAALALVNDYKEKIQIGELEVPELPSRLQ